MSRVTEVGMDGAREDIQRTEQRARTRSFRPACSASYEQTPSQYSVSSRDKRVRAELFVAEHLPISSGASRGHPVRYLRRPAPAPRSQRGLGSRARSRR
jgi:hypothetical protein